MIMRSIRNKRRAFKIPMIIFTVALSISLVGLFTYSPIEVNPNQEFNESSEIQSMLDMKRQLEQALKLDPDNEELHVNLGNLLYDLGIHYASAGDNVKANRYLKEATVPYLKALEIKPSLIGARVDLATAAYYSGQNDLAEEHFVKAIEQDPSFINGRINYGHFLLYAQGDKDGALEQWNKAMELEPDPTTRAKLETLISNVN